MAVSKHVGEPASTQARFEVASVTRHACDTRTSQIQLCNLMRPRRAPSDAFYRTLAHQISSYVRARASVHRVVYALFAQLQQHINVYNDISSALLQLYELLNIDEFSRTDARQRLKLRLSCSVTHPPSVIVSISSRSFIFSHHFLQSLSSLFFSVIYTLTEKIATYENTFQFIQDNICKSKCAPTHSYVQYCIGCVTAEGLEKLIGTSTTPSTHICCIQV